MGNKFARLQALSRGGAEIIEIVVNGKVTFFARMQNGDCRPVLNSSMDEIEYNQYQAKKMGVAVYCEATGHSAYHGDFEGMKRGFTIITGKR